jgi:ankyrin repeat protein
MFRRNTSEKSHSQHHLNIGSPLERSGSNSSVHFESNESGPELENSLSAKNWGLAKKCIAQGHGTSRHGLVHKAVKAQAPVEILEAMVEKGASVDETLEGKWTPLHVAAKYDASVSVVGFLVQSGALINTTLTTGETPLFIAVERDNEAVVEFLIGAGADANIARSSDGMTPLQVMVYKHAIPGQSPPWLMEVLIKKASANVNESSKDGTTALLIAIQKGATELVESLIQAGADVFTPKNSGDTPLIIALQNGCSLRLVELLLKAGADVNKANLNGESPISIAAQKNVDVSVMDLLIRAGGDVNRPTGVRFLKKFSRSNYIANMNVLVWFDACLRRYS